MTTPTPEERAVAVVAALPSQNQFWKYSQSAAGIDSAAWGAREIIAAAIRSAEQEAYKRGVEDAANIADDYALHSIELTKEFRAFCAAIRKAVEEEREACAVVADQHSQVFDQSLDGEADGAGNRRAEDIADAIRARATPAKE